MLFVVVTVTVAEEAKDLISADNSAAKSREGIFLLLISAAAQSF